jgi:hypothetical protein
MDLPTQALTVDFFETWYGRLGLAVFLGGLLLWLVRWVIYRSSRQEDRLRAELNARAEEDRKERDAKQIRDDAERDAMAKRLRELEESRYAEAKENTKLIVKALANCAAESANNDRSRRRLDATLQGLTHTLRNLPCNRGTLPSAAHPTPPPGDDDTPPEGNKS